MKLTFAGDAPDLARWETAARELGYEVIGRDSKDFVPTAADGILASGSASSVLQAARAAGAGMPLLVVPQAASAATVAYGLLPNVEDGRIVLPAWTARHSAAAVEYLQRFARGDLGDLTLLRCERSVPPSPSVDGRISITVIHERFLEDIDLLRMIGGDYQRITAVPLASDGGQMRQLSVTLGAAGGLEAIWTIAAATVPQWTLTVTGTRGTAVLTEQPTGEISLSIDGRPIPLPSQRGEAACLQYFARVVSGDLRRMPAAALNRPIWDDLVRAADLLEGLQRSIRRRRTIDLQFESTSERSQFKTQMTAIGCGVLSWAFVGTCLGLVLGSVLDPRDGSERRAAAAETVLTESDFVARGPKLSEESRQRIVDQVRIDGAEAIVLIEQQGSPGLSGVDSDRLSAVEALLRESPETSLAQITVQPLNGRWFRGLMSSIWAVTFAPLGIFLAVQLLIALTRPDSRPGRSHPSGPPA